MADNSVLPSYDLVSTGPVVRNGAVSRATRRYVDQLRIKTPSIHQAARNLSGGNQQKVVLAKWLATKPDVLILNGPTVGVDIGSKFTIHSILRELAADGMAVIIISDDISEVLTNCSRVLIMRGGQLREAVDPATTSEARLGELLAATDPQPGSSGPADNAGADQPEGGR